MMLEMIHSAEDSCNGNDDSIVVTESSQDGDHSNNGLCKHCVC